MRKRKHKYITEENDEIVHKIEEDNFSDFIIEEPKNILKKNIWKLVFSIGFIIFSVIIRNSNNACSIVLGLFGIGTVFTILVDLVYRHIAPQKVKVTKYDLTIDNFRYPFYKIKSIEASITRKNKSRIRLRPRFRSSCADYLIITTVNNKIIARIPTSYKNIKKFVELAYEKNIAIAQILLLNFNIANYRATWNPTWLEYLLDSSLQLVRKSEHERRILEERRNPKKTFLETIFEEPNSTPVNTSEEKIIPQNCDTDPSKQ